MIHVVHVITRTNVGGPSVMLVDLLHGLDPTRYKHTIIRGAVVDSEGDYLADHPVSSKVITLGQLRRSIGLWRELRSLMQLTRTLRRLQPDIVHTHMAKAGVTGRLAAVMARVPVRVHTFHGHLLHGYFAAPVSGIFNTIERLLRRLTTHSLVVGAATHRDLIAARIIAQHKSSVVLPGVKAITRYEPTAARTELGLAADGVVVGFVGRLAAIKRPDKFLRLAAAIPSAHFVLFGDGPLRDTVRRDAANLPNVSLREFSSNLALVLGALDVVVLTSDNEGVPLSLIEAAVAGLPVVSMRVGGVAEIVEHGVTGLLADNDVELHDAVARLVTDDALRGSMGAAAQQTVHERCSLTNYLAHHDELYTRLLAH
jgi:glycosyltransferase involved in cell wall biosynthesis